MDIKKIKYNHGLIKNKVRLEKELKMIEKEIYDNQTNCNHISICLGYDGTYQCEDNSDFICILCGKKFPYTNYEILDATNYNQMKYSHGETTFYSEERLKELQEITTNIILNNPLISEEQLIEKISQILKKDELKTKQILKKLEIKKGD